MGLLDSLFNSDSYGGQGGGLLDLLRQSQMQQEQYQPSQGLGAPPANFADRFSALPGAPAQFNPAPRSLDTAQFDPATYAPNQASPIAVGGYQMPRLGSAEQFNPQQALTPPNAQPAQGQMPQGQMAPMQQAPQQQPLPPAFGGTSYLERLNAGGGLIGSMLGDTTQQKNLKAQYDALVPLVGPQKAMLAVMNPEAGKVILAQALEKQQPTFGVIGEADGGGKAYGFIDPTKKTVTPYQAPGSENRGTITGPDGKEIPIPPGVDAKTFRSHVSAATADAATGKKTEVQAKSEKFANKMELAEKNVSTLQNEGASVTGRGLDMVPGGNFLQSKEYQKYRQAQDNFITALLRDESGAAIGTQEFKRYERELFPQPGDGPEVVAQKSQARKVAIEAMKKSAGPGYKAPETAAAPAMSAPSIQEGATATNPQTGQKLTFRGGKWQ